MEILRDPLWQFVGAVLTFLAVGATIVIYFLRRRKKRLTYDIISSSSLLSRRDELGDNLEIKYGGHEVDNVHLINLKFYNSGNVPIESEDFERCLHIDFGDDSRVLSSEVKSTSPQSLDISYDTDNGKVIFNPVLLNSKDSFSVKALVSGYQSELEVDARIVGVNSIRRGPEGQRATLAIMASGMLLTLVGIGLTIYSGETSSSEMILENRIQLISNISIGVGYVVALAAIFKRKKYRQTFFEIFGSM